MIEPESTPADLVFDAILTEIARELSRAHRQVDTEAEDEAEHAAEVFEELAGGRRTFLLGIRLGLSGRLRFTGRALDGALLVALLGRALPLAEASAMVARGVVDAPAPGAVVKARSILLAALEEFGSVPATQVA